MSVRKGTNVSPMSRGYVDLVCVQSGPKEEDARTPTMLTAGHTEEFIKRNCKMKAILGYPEFWRSKSIIRCFHSIPSA